MAEISQISVNKILYDLEDTTARAGLEDKVDKVEGKGLSTNDYTTAEKNKLTNIKGVDIVSGTTPASPVEIWIDTSKSYGELDPTQVVQSTGQSKTNVMSQKAVTDELANKSSVSVSASGTATDTVQYITVDGIEKKLAGGGSGEPAAYIKNASASGNTLTLTKKDDTTVVYTPTEQYQGTVTSVGAGTGLNISGTASVNPTVNIASTHKLPTTSEWSGKQNASSLETDVAAKGFTKNTGTVTSVAVKMNDSTVGTITTSGTIDLGTVITEHQDISGKLDKNTAITGATKTKITYDSKGLVTAGADLAASDIPDLPASKITSGTFADARIASASTWNAKQDALAASKNITIDASNNISALKYYKQSEVTGVAGTSSTKLSSTYNVTDASVTAYYDGMLVTFVLPCAGVSTYGSVFQFNSLGYHPIVYGTNSIVGTRYPVGGQITMVYNSVQTASAYLTKDTKTTITGCWQVCDYDATTKDATKVFDNYFRPYAGASAVYKYKLCALDKDNRIAPITITNQTDTTQVAKTPNSVGLKTGDLWFYTSSTAISASKALGGGALATTYYGDNMCAYNFNAAIPAYRMIYLRGTYNTTTGLFTLYNDGSSPCTSYYTVVPNNTANITLSSYFVSGYYYWLVGSTYSTADYLQVFGTNPLYYFDGTNLIPYQEHLVALKQDISTLEADVAAKGFTKNAGTITGITMNGSSKGTSGVVDLGTVITAHQDISGKQDISSLETDVAAKGFTKNTGTVTSVAAGAGLSISGTATTTPTVNVASTHKLPTTSEWSGKLDSTKCTYQTTAPTAAISDGGVHIVYLASEPTTKYDGYIYMIAES